MSVGQHLAYAKSPNSVDNKFLSENVDDSRVEVPMKFNEVTPREVNGVWEDLG